MVFFCWRRRESWNIPWSGQHWEGGGGREGGDIPHGICLLMNDGMVESICHRVCQHKERQTRRRERVRRMSFSMIGFFCGFLTTDVGSGVGSSAKLRESSELGCRFFFEALTKTSVGSSDSQRISCASKSAGGIVVYGAHTNSRHWNCGPWCPPLGSRPLCKQPLHLFPSPLLPPLEKIKFCKLLSSSCKNAHKDQVILEFLHLGMP
jgi:hypothetical protein